MILPGKMSARPQLNSNEVAQGSVLFLPPTHEVADNRRRRGFAFSGAMNDVQFPERDRLHENGFEHPVLVISRPASVLDKVHVLTVSWFHTLLSVMLDSN